MTRRITTLAALSRWRRLQEGHAAQSHRSCIDVERERRAHQHAIEAAGSVLQAQRGALLAEGLLDFERLAWASAIEARLLDDAESARLRADDAERATCAARARHVDARAALRVADDARARATEALNLRREKAAFDQLSDLLAGRPE